jgi:hypothetical membrane protein
LSKFTKIAGILGLATPIFVFVCISATIVSWSSFSWTENALSDLGVQWGLTANLFNTGLTVGGLLFMVFAAGLFKYFGKQVTGKVAACLLFVACLALAGIGVFNETYSPTHYIVSVMLFTFMPISLLVFVGNFWQARKRKLSMLTLTLGLIAAVPWILQLTVHYVSNVAIPETVSGVAGAVWTMVFGYLMLKENGKASSSG